MGLSGKTEIMLGWSMSAFNLQNEYRPNSFPDPPAPYIQILLYHFLKEVNVGEF